MKRFLKLRTNYFRIFLILCMVVIVGQLFSLQVIHYNEYVAQAESQHTMQNTIVAKRGEIYILDGKETVPIVMNSKVWTVIIDPQITRGNRKEVEKKIRESAGEFITGNFDEAYKSDKLRYYVVAKNVPYKQAQSIKSAKLDGVYFQGATKRVYPEGMMASGLLGFVNMDGVGQYGVEGALNSELAGKNGVLKTVKDVNNIPLTIGNDNVKVPAQDGKNIVLSIDRNIQNKAEQILAKKTKEYKVSHGTILVMNPMTGQIMAMASVPNYDPANYGEVEDAEIFQTNATMDAYEPASVCKTFAFAAAIDMGKMTPETTYNNTNRTVVDGWPINNAYKGLTGTVSMQQALKYSLNTGSTQSLRLLGDSSTEITQKGKDRLYDYYFNKFWLGKYTGIEIAESKGLIIPSTDVDGTNARYANMTFGQGLNITAMQILAGFSSVINGGEYYTPTVVAGEIVNDEYKQYQLPAVNHRTISSETSRTMRKMLVGTRVNTASAQKYDHGMYVGGKTGTAQAIRGGKYVMDETIATYVGFGAEDESSMPQYIVLTKFWEKNRQLSGETHALPVFNEMSEYLLNYLQLRK